MKCLAWVSAVVILVLLTETPGLARLPSNKKDLEKAQAFLRQAEAAWHKGLLEEAARTYRQAAQIKPDLAQAHYGLGLALARLERYSEAVSAFQEALYHQPSLTQARKDLGVTYLKLKKWPEAEQAFKSCLEKQPDAELYYDLGVAEGKQGKHREARDSFEKALRLKPEYVQALNNLGLANIKLNRWTEAQNAFEKALSFKADSPEAHLGLLACYIQQGDSQAAARTYQKLTALDQGWAQKADELLGR